MRDRRARRRWRWWGRGCAWALLWWSGDRGSGRSCSAPEWAWAGGARLRCGPVSLRAAERAARQTGDDRVGHAGGQREIRIAPGSARGPGRVSTDRPQRPPGRRPYLDDPAALERLLELPPLRTPVRRARMCECRERVRDTRRLARARDPLAGLRARLLGRLPATLPEGGDVTLAPRPPRARSGRVGRWEPSRPHRCRRPGWMSRRPVVPGPPAGGQPAERRPCAMPPGAR